MNPAVALGEQSGARKLATALFGAWAFTLLCRPQDYLTFLVPLRPALSLGLFTFLMSLTVKNTKQTRDNPQLHLYAALLAVLLFSSLFSIYTSASISEFFHYAFTACFVFIFCKFVTDHKTLTGMLRLCCIGIGIYCLCILGHGESIKERIVFGSMFDPNDIAYYVLSFLPFNLVVLRSGPARKILCAGNIVLGLTTIFKTGSRGGMLGLLGVLFCLFARRTKTMGMSLAARILVLATALVIFEIADINIGRFKSITDMTSDYNATDAEGRMAVWKLGLNLIAENPLTGVGFNRFPEGIGLERQQLEMDQARWQAAHNSLIQIGAESGIFGAALYAVLTINAFRIFRRSTKSSSPDLAKIGEMAEAGFLGNFVASMFLSQAYSAYWAFYIALSTVLHGFLLHQKTAGANAAASPQPGISRA